MSISLLTGLVVVEAGTTVKAGFCGKLLVDAGAEVIKLSLPGAGDAPFSEWLDRGKASVVLDWRIPEGEALLARLLARADVLVSDLEPPAEAAALREAASRHPRLVHTVLTDLGSGGPFADRPATDLIVSALSGMCYINGQAGRQPLREPGNQAAIVGALGGYIGTMAALANRSQTGEGQAVEVSALEAMVNVLSPSVLQGSYQDGAPRRHPSTDGFLFDCADGQVSIIISAQRSWETIVDVWGITIDPGDAEKFTEANRRTNMPAIRALLAPVLANKTRREVFEELCMVHVPCGMLMTPADLPHDPHLMQRGSFDTLAGAPGARCVFPGPGFRVANQPPTAERRLPVLGADTAAVLAPLGAEGGLE
ncbi:MAG: CoA transferase [Dehalococcoidia bacterium]